MEMSPFGFHSQMGQEEKNISNHIEESELLKFIDVYVYIFIMYKSYYLHTNNLVMFIIFQTHVEYLPTRS